MSTQDVIAIASFAIALLGVVYAFGKRDEKLSSLEKDLNSLGIKTSREFESLEGAINQHDKRIDRLNEFAVRLDQRVLQLQEQCFGEEKTNRLRETPTEQHYTTTNEAWYSENSGIEM